MDGVSTVPDEPTYEEELDETEEAAIQAAIDGASEEVIAEVDGPRIPLNATALFENPALVQFFGLMQDVCYHREAIHALKDATIRDTDHMEQSALVVRKQIMDVAMQLLTKRAEYELDLALAHLETYFEQMMT